MQEDSKVFTGSGKCFRVWIKWWKSRCLLLNLEQIGETAKKLSDELKNNISHIEWNKIIGLKNYISHEYEGIDLTIIFNIASKNIPKLLKDLEKHNV